MLDSVLSHIKAGILDQNPTTFQKGYAGARQYQDGKVVIYDNSEGQYVGLKDNESNYFYIRYLGDIDIDIAPTDNRSTSCDEIEGTAGVRLVAWVKRGDFSKLLEVLLHDIMATDFDGMDAADKEAFAGLPSLFFTRIVSDPEQIYKEETLTDENNNVKVAKGVTLVAIDFGVRFNYKVKANGCIDRNVCVECA